MVDAYYRCGLTAAGPFYRNRRNFSRLPSVGRWMRSLPAWPTESTCCGSGPTPVPRWSHPRPGLERRGTRPSADPCIWSFWPFEAVRGRGGNQTRFTGPTGSTCLDRSRRYWLQPPPSQVDPRQPSTTAEPARCTSAGPMEVLLMMIYSVKTIRSLQLPKGLGVATTVRTQAYLSFPVAPFHLWPRGFTGRCFGPGRPVSCHRCRRTA